MGRGALLPFSNYIYQSLTTKKGKAPLKNHLSVQAMLLPVQPENKGAGGEWGRVGGCGAWCGDFGTNSLYSSMICHENVLWSCCPSNGKIFPWCLCTHCASANRPVLEALQGHVACLGQGVVYFPPRHL